MTMARLKTIGGTVLMALAFLAGPRGAAAQAVADHGGFGAALFADQTPGAFQDRAVISENLDADTVSRIEPAAGDAAPAAKPETGLPAAK